MRFLSRSALGLFIFALTIGLIALAAFEVGGALEKRLAGKGPPARAQERIFAARVLTATPASHTPRVDAIGEVASRRTLDLRFRTGGTITALHANFVDGGRVAAGELLVALDPTDAEAARALARADLAEASAEQVDAANGLALARDDLGAAGAQADLRRAALARQDNLRARGVGTDAAQEAAALALAAAEQAILSKRQALLVAEARRAKADTAHDRRVIGLAEAERRLRDLSIIAEFSGVLGGVTALQGGVVGANERLGQLVDPAVLDVEIRVSNAQYARLLDAEGKLILGPVSARLDLFGEALRVPGTLSREGATTGDGRAGRLLFARLDPAGATAFRPGDFVTVGIDEPTLERVILLPSAAVDSAGRVLVLGEEDRLSEVQVEVLRQQGTDVLVRSVDIIGAEVVAARSPLLGAGIRIAPVRVETPGIAEPDMIALEPERRQRLVAFIEGNSNIPADAKARILKRLQADKVPAEMVSRIESRMGG